MNSSKVPGPLSKTTILNVKIIPGAAQEKIVGWLGDTLKIKVQSPPEKGKANAAVFALLADKLDVPEKSLSICAGHTSRYKVIEIQGLSQAALAEKLAHLAS